MKYGNQMKAYDETFENFVFRPEWTRSGTRPPKKAIYLKYRYEAYDKTFLKIYFSIRTDTFNFTNKWIKTRII